MSPFCIVRSRLAERDLIDIWNHIANDSSTTADKVLRRITRDMERLRDFPRIGPRHDWISRDLRGLNSRPYIIFYKVDDESRAVHVVRVMHMARNIEALFL